MIPFVHLRVHSDFSLSDGASGDDDLIGTVKKLGMPALAITDTDNLFGAWYFSYKAKKAGIQPLIGCHLHAESLGKRLSFTLIAQDEAGYVNLCRIARAACFPQPTASGKDAPPKEPIVPWEVLEENAGGLIMLTGGTADGLLPYCAVKDPVAANELFRWLLAIFGDRLYVEICRSGEPGEVGSEAEEALLALAYGQGVDPVPCLDGVIRTEAPIVATSDVWYATVDRHEPWMLLQTVKNKGQLIISNGAVTGAGEARYHLRTPAEMGKLFADLPEAVRNTAEVARRCAFAVSDRKPILPAFPCDSGLDESSELRAQARQGLDQRLEKATKLFAEPAEYRERLEFELGVIERMGFPGYFLIVSDFIKWAKSQDIPVGPGRGSGAGSVAAWALTITDLDPLEFGLLFERFLNPDRVSMPDFDIDFCQDRRDEVIDYVSAKYGRDRVAMIATFSEIKSKTAIKDAGRVIIDEQLGTVGFGEMNELSKLIPGKAGEDWSLARAYRESDDFRSKVDTSEKLKALVRRAGGIEGLYRQVGAHAAGIVIAARPLEELAPVHWSAKESMQVCSFDQKGAEATGQVKFDFLGLTTLSIMKLALRYVRETRGLDIDISSIPKDDAAVYASLAEGRTNGVFQLESGGMTDAVRKIAPTRLEDIVAIVALYRPGPMDQIDVYAARKKGDPWEPPYHSIRDVLEETYGIMVYQEQVMTISRQMAGYTLGAADLLRRAMGKKIRSEMDAQREIFVKGCVNNGINTHKAEEVFDLMAKFADYGFNKSHAAAYAWIAYQTAWLKYHYPAEFLSALMSYNTDKPEKLAAIKDELDELGIPLLPPDINHSRAAFKPEVLTGGTVPIAVRFGLTAITGIKGTLADLERVRANGQFTSIEDFHLRGGTLFNKGQLENLACAGAFSGIAANRRQAAEILAWLMDKKTKGDKVTPTSQVDLFGGAAPIQIPREMLEKTEWGDVSDREFKSVGFYFSTHPIDHYKKRLFAGGVRRRLSFRDYMKETHEANLRERKICVMVESVVTRISKAGNPYLMAAVAERNDSYSVLFFTPNDRHSGKPKGQALTQLRTLLDGARVTRKPVVIVSDIQLDGEQAKVVGRDVWEVESFLAGIAREVIIGIDPRECRGLKPQEQRDLDAASALGEAGKAARTAVLTGLLHRKISAIKDWLDKEWEAAAEGAIISVRYPGNTPYMLGRYRLPDNGADLLKMMDGVVSIREKVLRLDDAAAGGDPLNAQALAA